MRGCTDKETGLLYELDSKWIFIISIFKAWSIGSLRVAVFSEEPADRQTNAYMWFWFPKDLNNFPF